DPRGAAHVPPGAAPVHALGDDDRLLVVRGRTVRAGGGEPAGRPAGRRRARGNRGVPAPGNADRDDHPRREGHRGLPRGAVRDVCERGLGPGAGARRPGGVPRRARGAGAHSAAGLDRGEAHAPVRRGRARERGGGATARVRGAGRGAVRARLGGEARPAAPDRRGGGARRGCRVRGGRHHHHRHHDPDGRAATQPRDRHHATRRRHRRVHPPAVPAAGGDQRDAGRPGGDRPVVRRLRPHQPLAAPGGVLLARAGAGHRRVRDADRAVRERGVRGRAPATGMKRRRGTTSRDFVEDNRGARHASPRRRSSTFFRDAVLALALPAVLAAQRPQPFDQQLRDNQQRLEGIRRERSEVEQELERLRTQAHSLSDELANIERQKETTNRIVNELDRQINSLSDQIDHTTVDLLLAQDALSEKRAVLERRLVDIYKRGPLYAYQVLLAAESFGDLLSRYKYLYLVTRQDRLLASDMSTLQRRIA